MAKVLQNDPVLKELQDQEKQTILAPHIKLGNETVVAFLNEVQLPDSIKQFEAAAEARTEYYKKEAKLKKLKIQRGDLIAAFDELPAVMDVKAKLKELHETLYVENVNPNGGIIPRIPPEGSMSREYNALQAKLDQAKTAYLDAVLPEIENQITHLQNEMGEMNLRKLEQKEWNSGRK